MSDPAGTARARSVTRLPHPCLRDLVTTYHGYRYEGLEPGMHYGLPATSLTMVLAFDQPVDVGWLADPESRRCRWALVSGLSVLPAGIHHGGSQHGIQLELTPLGARTLLGLPAAALHRELVSLEDVLGSRAGRLYDGVAAPAGWADRFAVLDRELLRLAALRGDNHQARDETLDHAWRRVHETGGSLPVARLAHEVGWSRRHLSERFADEFGIGPKQTARLVRFGRARELVGSRGTALAEVAARCGYADQAHLTREWCELAGVPPTVWLRGERPFLQDRSGST